jgi:hypothetical protein
LILLTALVLLAHWAVLRAAPLALAAHASPDAGGSWSFATRTIDAEPAPRAMAVATPQPVAAPARRPANQQTAVPRRPESPGAMDSNTALALEKYDSVAIESEAPSSTIDAPALATPLLLAAATPVGKVTDAVPETGRPATAVPPAAKAVRKFAIPASARLKYDVKGEVKGFPYHVNGDLLWVQDGKTYDARMEISHFLLGSRVQTSTGQLTSHGLEPTRFGDKVKSEVAAHFDREKNKVTFSANTPDVPLLPGAQDQLSVFMQLAAMLGAEPLRFPQGTTLPVQAIGPRSAEAWVFTVGASEKLVLPGGELNAVRLWRDPLGTYDPKVEIWLAPDVGYLPVRIRLTQSTGDVVDQQWRATQKP